MCAQVTAHVKRNGEVAAAAAAAAAEAWRHGPGGPLLQLLVLKLVARTPTPSLLLREAGEVSPQESTARRTGAC